MSTTLTTLAAWIVATFVGVAFVTLAVRGRREATGPRCRRCGYDVSRRPAGVERCSECGADLARPRAITVSTRTTSRWTFYPAVVVLWICLGGLIVESIDFPFGTAFHAHAPMPLVRLLARHYRGSDGDSYRDAWHACDPSIACVDPLLDLQGDARVAWRFELERALEDALREGSMSDAQRGRFVRQLLGRAQLRVRTPLRVGDPLFVELTADARDAWTSRPLYARSAIAARVDSELDVAEPEWSNQAIDRRLTWSLAPARWGGVGLAPGRHRVAIHSRRQVADSGGIPFEGTRSGLIDPVVDDQTTLEVDVLPADTPVGTAVPAPEDADVVARSVALDVVRADDGRAYVTVWLRPAKVARSFVLFAIVDGVERRIGQIAADANQDATAYATFAPCASDAQPMAAVTIVLVGEALPLVETIDQRTFWPGRIIFTYVPIRLPAVDALPVEPSTRPYCIEVAQRVVQAHPSQLSDGSDMMSLSENRPHR